MIKVFFKSCRFGAFYSFLGGSIATETVSVKHFAHGAMESLSKVALNAALRAERICFRYHKEALYVQRSTNRRLTGKKITKYCE